jgi:amidohydrolase
MFDVVVIGGGGPGAYPHTAVDVLYAACQCVTALQSIVSRNVSPMESAVVTVGVIKSGSVRNVIPSRAEFSGIIRTLDPDVRKLVVRRLRETVEGVCAALGADVTLTLKQGYPVLCNDGDMTRAARKTASETIGEANVRNGAASLGVEDFAYFALERPSCFFNLGVRNEDMGLVYPLHSDLFDIDESSLPVGAAVLAALAIAGGRTEARAGTVIMS